MYKENRQCVKEAMESQQRIISNDLKKNWRIEMRFLNC